MLLNWNADPVLLNIGPLSLRWYGILFIVGFLIGLELLRRMCKKENIPTKNLDPILTYIFTGAIVGARLAHCFFYEPEYYLSHPLEIPAIWQGGLASHGGIAGVILAVILFSRKYKEYSLVWLVDRVAILTAMTGGFIRLGNLMNSEIVGKPTNGTWGVVFHQVDQLPRHPAQVYESISYFLLAALLYGVYRQYKRRPPAGLLFGLSMIGIFATRFLLEFIKENQAPFESSLPLNMGQLLSIPFVLAGIYIAQRALRRKAEAAPSKPARR